MNTTKLLNPFISATTIVVCRMKRRHLIDRKGWQLRVTRTAQSNKLLKEQLFGVSWATALRKFPREYMEKYPSAKKVYDAIAGPRRLGSKRTTENYINYVAIFVDYLGVSDPKRRQGQCARAKSMQEKRLTGLSTTPLKSLAGRIILCAATFLRWSSLTSTIKVEWSKHYSPIA